MMGDLNSGGASGRAVAALEEWRDIEGFPSYKVSNLGRVKNSTNNRVLALHDDGRGYWQVGLPAGSGKKSLKVHRLVCAAFHGPAPDGCEVAHRDGDRKNAKASNLLWATPKENAAHKLDHGTYYIPPPREAMRRGESHPHANLSDAELARFRERAAAGERVATLSADYGINRTHAYKLLSGQYRSETND